MCLDKKVVRASSWRKEDGQSEEFDKVLHRTDIKKRTFSPDHDVHANLFSPLLQSNHKNVKQINHDKKLGKNSIKLGSKDSQSQKSSFIQSDLVSRLNSKTYPKEGRTRDKEKNNQVMPFEEVNEEDETSLPPLHLEKVSDITDE